MKRVVVRDIRSCELEQTLETLIKQQEAQGKVQNIEFLRSDHPDSVRVVLVCETALSTSLLTEDL